MVLALAGDSTITRLVVPLATGASLLPEEARDDVAREVVDFVALVVVLEAALRVVLPVFLVVVAIYGCYPVLHC